MKWIRSKEEKELLVQDEVFTVQDVHNDFNSIQDELLKIFESKLTTVNKESIEKQNRLSKLGFKNTPQSEIADKERTALRQNEFLESEKKTFQEYQMKYPIYKWISHDSVLKLCEKYGLVLGDVDRFTSEVPDKNLIEMENFEIKKEDCLYQYRLWRRFDGDDIFTINYERFEKEKDLRRTSSDAFDFKKCPFKIVALQKDFDMTGMELRGKLIVPKIKEDPIVLQPVSGSVRGYLIVTAWGEEASDPLVVNQINN